MMVITEQDAVTPNPLLGLWSPAISGSQAPQVTEMVTAHNWETLQLPLTIWVVTFKHQRTFFVLSGPGRYIQGGTNDGDLRP